MKYLRVIHRKLKSRINVSDVFCPVVDSADCSRNSVAAALKGGDKDAADRKREKRKKHRNEMKQQSKAADH